MGGVGFRWSRNRSEQKHLKFLNETKGEIRIFQDINSDRLHIDVWNFETISGEGKVVDKLRRISEVKDGRGLKQLISNTVAPPSADRLIGIFFI